MKLLKVPLMQQKDSFGHPHFVEYIRGQMKPSLAATCILVALFCVSRGSPQDTTGSSSPITVGANGYVVKLDVNLVLVEATVSDPRNRIIDGLMQNDFRVLEDGVEQPIRYFSRDELPLAVALVIDRSGSIGPHLGELRHAALETLAQLKPDDQVALFAFAAGPEQLVDLTADRQRIARAISNIRPGGGTNINDALFSAIYYLGHAASNRRHAVILVSDNQDTVRGFANEKDLVRLALQTETVVYSLRIGGTYSLWGLSEPFAVPGTPSINSVTQESGGEIIDASQDRSLGAAMAMVISRLKRRYTIGYLSPNKKHDGAYHSIEIELAGEAKQKARYSVFARQGYYAPRDGATRGDNPN
ncbi:MAG: VWA domain-containing protein [Deltaproteobacteria bacterium]